MRFKHTAFVTALMTSALTTSVIAKTDPTDLVGPLAEYKMYVMAEVKQYVAATKAFTDAVKKGDIATAKKLYAPARQHYERIEPVAELFSDLDASMDAREDDYEQGAKAPRSPVSTVWKKRCGLTTAPKVSNNMQINCTKIPLS
jgi:iron uptake system EfeUOB component EfeO/EfeM